MSLLVIDEENPKTYDFLKIPLIMMAIIIVPVLSILLDVIKKVRTIVDKTIR
jgi:hypothetical protein